MAGDVPWLLDGFLRKELYFLKLLQKEI